LGPINCEGEIVTWVTNLLDPHISLIKKKKKNVFFFMGSQFIIQFKIMQPFT